MADRKETTQRPFSQYKSKEGWFSSKWSSLWNKYVRENIVIVKSTSSSANIIHLGL